MVSGLGRAFKGFISKPAKLAVRTAVRSVIFAWLDLLRMEMESSESKARRGAAWMWPKEGWPAQAARSTEQERGGKSVW
jgi:hypothetical protein